MPADNLPLAETTKVSIRQGCEQLRQRLLAEGLPAAAARILSARDITCREDIMPPLRALPPPSLLLPQVARFSDLLADAITRKKLICVVGDYDADGMCATVLAVDCLMRLGASVIWRIPDRFRHGYGLHLDIVDDAAKQGSELLLTVDNGISAYEAVSHAKKRGLQVCITDHHLLEKNVLPPEADCIVNPQCPQSDGTIGAGKNLAGVGVAFYAFSELRTHMKRQDINMANYLDLTAVGTVADCVPMDKINRTLVEGGLSVIRKGRARPGLVELMKNARLLPSNINSRDISYKIAPRINSAGRLGQPEWSVKLLFGANNDAVLTAKKLEEMNKERVDSVNDAMKKIQVDSSAAAIIVADKNLPAGILGILAGRLTDKYDRPSIVFGQSGDHWRGSARAPAGDSWDLHHLTTTAAQIAGDSVLKFGGHRKAVGISVRSTEEFARAFIECCRQIDCVAPKWQVDTLPPSDELTVEAIACMDRMVWGVGFSHPLFFAVGEVSNVRQLRNSCHWRFDWKINGHPQMSAIVFNREENPPSSINAVFSLFINNNSGEINAKIEEIL